MAPSLPFSPSGTDGDKCAWGEWLRMLKRVLQETPRRMPVCIMRGRVRSIRMKRVSTPSTSLTAIAGARRPWLSRSGQTDFRYGVTGDVWRQHIKTREVHASELFRL